MTIQEAVQQFRDAAIQNGTCKTAKEDHRFHRMMSRSYHTLAQHGDAGRRAFEQLLDDESPDVRIWVAAQMLSEGNTRAVAVMEAIQLSGFPLGFGAEMSLREFNAGRLGSPFPKTKSSNQPVQRTGASRSGQDTNRTPGAAGSGR